MQSFQSLTVILLSVFTQINGKEVIISTCGQRIPGSRPLMTNSPTTSQWPWHAAIYHRVDELAMDYKCGGSLISSNLIITAGHCVSRHNEPIDTAKVLVSLGRLNLGVNESSAQSFEVAKIVVHPHYSSQDMNNDIAMIRLATDATFNNYVQPICLWDPNQLELSNVVGREGTVVGWGYTELGKSSNVLRKALMPVVASLVCLATNRNFFGFYLSATNFCAGVRNGTSVCDGDSGGSMTFDENGIYYIRGIVSVSAVIVNRKSQQKVCDSYNYALFTDVAQYLPWIDEVSSELTGCETKVECDYVNYPGSDLVCALDLNLQLSERKCRLILSESTNASVTLLKLRGEFESIPNLFDAARKFETLTTLELSALKLKYVERSRLTAFRRIEKLLLYYNEITELASDTFDDLKNLQNLELRNNQLNEIHRNLFKELSELEEISLNQNQIEHIPEDVFRNNEKLKVVWLADNKIKSIQRNIFKNLRNLEMLYLESNELEILPNGLFRNNRELIRVDIAHNKIMFFHRDLFMEQSNLELLYLDNNNVEVLPNGLFRNNQQLRVIWLNNNKIKKIETDFQNLPNLLKLNFEGNICINEFCEVDSFCRTNSIEQMQQKFSNKCPK